MSPTIIHSHDLATGVDMAEEASWAASPGAFRGVPILGETLHQEWELDPESQEFSAFGGRKAAGYKSKRVVGDVRCEARFDAPWFNILLANAFGEEKLVVDRWLDADSAVTGSNIHIYRFNAARYSLQFQSHKSGPSTAGKLSNFAGCKCSGFAVEFPPDGIPFFTFRYIGKAETLVDETTAPLVAPVGAKASSGRLLSNAQAYFKTGNTLTALDIRGFSIDADLKLQSDRAYANDTTNVPEPGIVGNRAISGSITTALAQDFGGANKPKTEFLAGTASGLDLIFAHADDIGATGKKYGMRIQLPRITFEVVEDPIREAGEVTQTIRFVAYEGTTGVPSSATTDMRAIVAVSQADDSDTYFSAEAVQS